MQTDSSHISFLLSKDIKIIEKKWKEIGANSTSNMVIFQILLLSNKRVISKERNTIRASNPRASLTWTDNTSKDGYGKILDRWHLTLPSVKSFQYQCVRKL